MASLAQQLTGLKCPPLSSSRLSRMRNLLCSLTTTRQSQRGVVSTMAISIAQTREREKLKELFEEAYEHCHIAPMEGVAFTLDDFHAALDKYDFDFEVGTKVALFLAHCV